jgi:hypothetical protein
MNDFSISNINEVYGNNKLNTPNSNPTPKRGKRNQDVEENMRYEQFQNSLKQEPKPERGSVSNGVRPSRELDERMRMTLQQHRAGDLSEDNDIDTESVISMETGLTNTTNNSTVVFGENKMNNIASNYQEIKENVNYMLMGNDPVLSENKKYNENLGSYGENQRKNYEPLSPASMDIFSGTLLQKIREKIELVITKLNSDKEEERRSIWEILIHVLLYFLTGIFVIIILSYVFNLGKQNIKISLVK